MIDEDGLPLGSAMPVSRKRSRRLGQNIDPISPDWSEEMGSNSLTGHGQPLTGGQHEWRQGKTLLGKALSRRSFLWAAVVALIWAGLNGSAFAVGNAFKVANYPVDATAENAVAAKKKAIDDGQQAAFRSLLKRLVPVSAYDNLEQFKTVPAGNYVDGLAIRSEQNSRTRYIASLDFSFEPNSVRQMLQSQGIPFVDRQAQEVVLVPVIRQPSAGKGPDGAEFVAATGAWASIWPDLDVKNSLAPLRVASLLPTMHSDTVASMMSGQDGQERVLETEYGTALVVMAVAEVDKAAGKVHVTLVGQDGVGPVSWSRSYPVVDGDFAYALELAAVIGHGVMEGRWKAVQSGQFVAAGGMPDVFLDVQFRDTSEWNDIRGRILNLPSVDDVRVGNVSAYNAQVMVKYPGGGSALAWEMQQQGLQMQQSGNGWLLRRGY